MSYSLSAAILIAGLISAFAPLLVRAVLGKLNVFDVPNSRSSHTKPTLRGGGIAPMIALVAASIYSFLVIDDIELFNFKFVALVSIAIALVGLVEDLKGLPMKVRASLQLLGGVGLSTFLLLGENVGIAACGIAVFVFAYNINAANFMDGINGISALQGFVVGLIFAISGWIYSLQWLVLSGLVLSLIFVAFLPWNLISPGMFLGDVGSYLLGSMIISTSMLAWADGVSWIVAIAPLFIYWADTGFTLARRFVAGKPVFEAHRTHVYQQLTDRKLSHIKVAVIVTLFTAGCGVVAFAVATSKLDQVVGALLLFVIAALYLLLPTILRRGIK
ncbi:undecaprenyl phosphate alpha-n-acetylglucosaminyltransferase [Corynebacterium suranareeae]|uniref:Undecaprenyl phosphate alpha-n-acetylglucosaminyltransferase n=1 Tax=Corynebacterium suranareeae TaxID=2506452 RepID=A0A160PM12_9CORY|nr:UDP-phosphate alpha-N-acetylglucosaminyltransferase [Corynebacterium suranareeae]BAU94749.1 undecaprenyl phosphate alpha-n-acetylglucosaminyltransferase [Corynebacterium suranareeae]